MQALPGFVLCMIETGTSQNLQKPRQTPMPKKRAERGPAVKQLFLDQGGQGIDRIPQPAEGTDIAAEEPPEQEGEPAQAQKREGEAVRLQHLSGTDPLEQQFHPVEPGHEGTGHGEKEEDLKGGPQQGTAFFGLLVLLRRRQGLFFGSLHHTAAFPSASATAPIRPSEVRVAPETVSIPSVDWADRILSSTGRDCV